MLEQTNTPSLLNDPIIRKSFSATLFFFLLFFLLFIWKWSSFPSELPLYYTRPRGPEQLGSMWELLLLPILSLSIFLIHFFIASRLFKREKLLSQLLMISQTVIIALLFITCAQIIFLIT
ncbi:hypothetical protein HYW55_04950 [Candidatus Gottesmanbacteria bacterium]|nr:hypothetical protein [Candidatus Gottesmanbacteria bacterium]